MKRLLNCAVFAAALACLSGCEVIRAVTFVPDRLSGPRPDYKDTDVVKFEGLTGFEGISSEDVLTLKKVCDGLQTKPGKAEINAEAVGPVGTALIAFGATTFVNALGNEIEGYLDRKQKEFQYAYAKSLYWTDEKALPKCLVLSRTLKPEKGNGEIVFQAVLGMEFSAGWDFMRFVPLYVNLARSGARTSVGGKVDVDIELTIAAGFVDQAKNRKIATETKRVSFKALHLGETSVAAVSEERENRWLVVFPAAYPTPWFPSLAVNDRSTFVATLTAEVLETGDGSKEFGAYKTQFAATRSAFKDLILKIVEAQGYSAK